MYLFHNLTSYLDANFKGFQIKKPLFFSGFPALRFDLQDENLDTCDNAYFDEVVKRMKNIHAVSIDGDDDIAIFYRKYTYKRRKIRKHNYLFKQINANTARVQFKKNKTIIYEDGPYRKADNSSQAVIYDKAANIKFSNIYLSIANTDFNRRPSIDGELFVVNLTKQTVMLMYDDRGCDLISPNIELLKGYYNSLTGLILEVNRPEIIQRLQIKS
jgi:hypothetical protein